MGFEIPWYAWIFIGLAIGFICSKIEGAVSGLLLFLSVLVGPIIIYNLGDSFILPTVCFLGGISLPINYYFKKRTLEKQLEYEKKVRKQNERAREITY